MKLKRVKRSDRIEQDPPVHVPNRKGKGHKTVDHLYKGDKGRQTVSAPGKGNNLNWEREIVMGGMKAASQSLKDFVKGKKDREDPLTELIKRSTKKR